MGLRKGINNDGTVLLHGDTIPQPSSSTFQRAPLTTKVTDYLVGSQLEEALAAGQDIEVYWPFANEDISDWIQAEAIWYMTSYCRQIMTIDTGGLAGNMPCSVNSNYEEYRWNLLSCSL